MKGRPPSRNKGLRDGFYLEVFNKGANTGIKIRKETEAEMMEAVEEYRRENKTVTVLGEHKKGEWMNPATAHRKSGSSRRQAKRVQEQQQKKAAKEEQKQAAKEEKKAAADKKVAEQAKQKPIVAKKVAKKEPVKKDSAKKAVAKKTPEKAAKKKAIVKKKGK